jgi:hypothetical protein
MSAQVKARYLPGWEVAGNGQEWRVLDAHGNVVLNTRTYQRADAYARSCKRTPRVGRPTKANGRWTA